jgi:hypothetical protein
MLAGQLDQIVRQAQPYGTIDDLSELQLSVIGAAARLLHTVSETRHMIELRDDGWTIQHPVHERLDFNTLFDCDVRWISEDLGVRGRFYLEWDPEALDYRLGPAVS